MRALTRLLLMVAAVMMACDKATVPPPPPPGSGDDGLGGGGPGDPPPPVVGSVYPRVAAFIGNWEHYSATDLDTIAMFDLVCLTGGGQIVLAELRNRNPDVDVFYRTLPQNLTSTDWGREWNWEDRVRRYTTRNGWALMHHNGTEANARGWGDYWRWLDFTSHCPLGIYTDPREPELDSQGLTCVEWLATRFIPWFIENHLVGYDGLWWEVVAQQPNRYWWWVDAPAPDGGMLDWNRNSLADWQEGGVAEYDRFRADWDSVTTWWVQEVRSRVGYEYPIIGGGDSYAPPLDYFHGFKNEDFLNRNRWATPYWDWWDEFYTHTSNRPRRGYVYQRDHALDSWNLSVNQIFWYDDEHWSFSNPDLRRKYVRFALATTLLGDGYFCFYRSDPVMGDDVNPWMGEFYELGLGTRADPFQKSVFGADTLYTRSFRDDAGNVTGRVTVNPSDREIAGIPAQDAEIVVLTDPE